MANETRLRQNFLGGLIEDNPLTAAATVLTSGGLPLAPVVDATSHLPIILDPDGVYGEPEIVHVIAHAATASTATLLRAREGTVAREHKKDTPWVHGPTKFDWDTLTVSLTGGYTRTTAAVTSTSLALGEHFQGLIALGPGYRLYAIATTRAARVRVYTTVEAQAADLARPVGTDPPAGSGLMLDYGTTANNLSDDLSPLVDGYDGKANPNGSVPITITNLDPTAGTVGVSLTYVRTE